MFIEICNIAVDARHIAHYAVSGATAPNVARPMWYLNIYVDIPNREPIRLCVDAKELAFFKEQLSSYTRIVSYTKEGE